MPKIEVEVVLEPTQIRDAFEQLNVKEKLKLVEEFERETRRARWDVLIKKIRQRTKKYPISQKEINRICEEVRQQHYERNKGCR